MKKNTKLGIALFGASLMLASNAYAASTNFSGNYTALVDTVNTNSVTDGTLTMNLTHSRDTAKTSGYDYKVTAQPLVKGILGWGTAGTKARFATSTKSKTVKHVFSGLKSDSYRLRFESNKSDGTKFYVSGNFD
ncbi:hypothetical protein [Gottfriedia acidiceleris]|uniref:hypothetical protein n=1 Tax=Gottfriedia acidiceleris TaxID=371036 RepID=UPI000B4499CD|nr:hypothetical protein [Gottfriedia acidiceleris]